MSDDGSLQVDPALGTFIAESHELLYGIEAGLLDFEHGRGDAETINALFRAAHTIKGSSGLFGLDDIVAFTHVVEGVLDRVRAGALEFNAALAATLLECRDHIAALIDAVATGVPTDSPELEQGGAEVLTKLNAQAGFTTQVQAPPTTFEAPVMVSRAVDDGARARTDSWHLSIRFSEGVLRDGMDPLSFIRYLTTFGAITGIRLIEAALPPVDAFDPESCYLGYEICLQTAADKQRIESAFEFVREDCTLRILPPRSLVSDYVALIQELPEANIPLGEILVACGTLTPAELNACLQLQSELAAAEGSVRPLGELLMGGKLVQPPVVEAALEKQRQARASTESVGSEARSIRVDGEKLDRLIDLIGELVIAGASTSLMARKAGLIDLNESTLRLGRLVEDIREQALKLRMVPIGGTFARFQRIVRDVARESGKAIRLQVSGAETELDKTLIESIADPLTHLVRNAIDHGIETPEVREARGKSPEGSVRLNAYHDSGSVVIEVADDGNGLSREKILRKALDRGLISDAEALTDAQIRALIFEPGFSTAEQITNLSGRGVGMDVVKRNVAALRGTVEVESQEGHGTLMRIRLPLTLAIIEGFQVGVGRSSFVIPLDMVEECVELSAAERESGNGHHYINLRGTVLPFIRLREMFEVKGASGKRESIVVVQCAGRRAGIVVDELLGELQAVIKPLSKIFTRLQGIGGSTILGSGEVALILDVAGLLERRLVAANGAHVGSPPAAPVQVE